MQPNPVFAPPSPTLCRHMSAVRHHSVAASSATDYSLADFSIPALREAKGATTVSVCIPARNEESTVGSIVSAIDERFGGLTTSIVDEIIVVDDRSTDATAFAASNAGAKVVSVADILPGDSVGHGKGNVLWKSVAASTGDIIVWVDADLTSFDPNWITGLVGPLLTNPDIAFVKAHFDRPEREGSGGGRTTEIMVRPLFSTFFPHLSVISQPLVGEYAARRTVLEQVPFSMGYGVETGLLIDLANAFGLDRLAQVDLGVRTHRSRPVTELSAQAMEILHVVLDRAGVPWQPHWGSTLLRPGSPPIDIQTDERPPLASVPAYRSVHHP